MNTNDPLSMLFTLTVNNLYLNIFITVLGASAYLYNVVILRLRKTYLPLNNKMICIFLFIPLLNLSFLILNLLILNMNIKAYTIKKKKLTKSTYKYHNKSVPKENLLYTVKSQKAK